MLCVREVILDIEVRTNFLGRLPLDHVSHGLAGQVKQRFDVQVVRRSSQLVVSRPPVLGLPL